MSWTQVYVTGLAQTIEPSDEDLEDILAERYRLKNDDNNDTTSMICWAGPGTTLFKRDKGVCRGYAFLSFHTLESAEVVIHRINTNTISNNTPPLSSSVAVPQPLRAELSKPKSKGKKKKHNNNNTDHSDVRLRRQRGAPVRKHPVITSSDKKKTGLGNKTR